jgi:hypothetical protein
LGLFLSSGHHTERMKEICNKIKEIK